MKKLRIIVRKDSAIDSWLADSGFIFDKVVPSYDSTLYKISLNHKMELINLLISKFRLKNFRIQCLNGRYVFSVLS